MLMKEIKDDRHRGKDIPYSWLGKINIVKVTILIKTDYRVNAISIKLPMAFSTELEQFFLKCVWKQTNKKPWIAKAILRKKNGAGGIRCDAFRLNYKATSAKQFGTGTERKL